MPFSWKRLRIGVLLLLLAYVAHGQWQATQLLSWQRPIKVAIYPVSGDGSAQTVSYIQQLNQADFSDLGDYFANQAAAVGLAVQPFVFSLRGQVATPPPALPVRYSRLGALLWSLRLRWYNWRTATGAADINLYALYYNPASSTVLKHSTALQKGGVGYIMLFADPLQQGQNNIVLAHELLHTVGATDKYNLQTGLPHYPHGYANPTQQPLHPQQQAELMGGRMAINASKAQMPLSLAATTLGPLTLQQIGWVKRR